MSYFDLLIADVFSNVFNIETPILRIGMLVLPAKVSPTSNSNFLRSCFGSLKNTTFLPLCFFRSQEPFIVFTFFS